MTATLPVMRDRHAEIGEFPLHANVMALVKALDEPVPWALLLEIVTQLQHATPAVALGDTPIAQVEGTLLAAVTDLRSIGLVKLGPAGTVFTEAGEETIREWNGQFKERLEAAKSALLALLRQS